MAKKRTKKSPTKKDVQALKHTEASRKNIPTAEFESIMHKDDQKPVPVTYPRPGMTDAQGNTTNPLEDEMQQRNRDLDPQLIWRGKYAQDNQDGQDAFDDANLVVQAPPLFIQEKVHPKVLIDDLRRQTEAAEIARKAVDAARAGDAPFTGEQFDLFADFNGLPDDLEAKTEFYQHDAHWSNRMILGDSLSVMASLAEREGLRGGVQCIYLDPPYGIKFNSNFQWSTTSRDVKDGKADHITREPEQVKAFRDTWRDGIHSYLTYLRDRLTAARDLLHDTGSIFVQIGDENVHRVRAVMDEVFGDGNFISELIVVKSSGLGSVTIPRQNDFILWYAKAADSVKIRSLRLEKALGGDGADAYVQGLFPDLSARRITRDEQAGSVPLPEGMRVFRYDNLTKPGPGAKYEVVLEGKRFTSKSRWWGIQEEGMLRAIKANRVAAGKTSLSYIRFLEDSSSTPLSNLWTDTATGSGLNKVYVVQTTEKVVQRCLLMATDPGDLVLDPTCGSGTTAYVAEQWGRRWITIDTSRVSLALARARIMGARYPYYLLADSLEGREKEAQITRTELPETSRARQEAGPLPRGRGSSASIRQGFVYERVPHITLKSIANNSEIDVIWERFQERLEPLREKLNKALKQKWEEWEIPRDADAKWSADAKDAHEQWWEQRIQRQKEIDASIAARADFEYLYDKPYEDKKKVRVAGPFTVESLSPHRVLGVGADDELIDPQDQHGKSKVADPHASPDDFASVILENLKTAGVQQAHKGDKITFNSIKPWPGHFICAEGRYVEGTDEELDKGQAKDKRAAIFIGPEFGTVARQDLVMAAREAGDADFDVVIACAFNYEALASEFSKLGRIPVLKARMNADLHMADDLKNTGKGNLFVIFGEPDIDILLPEDAPEDADLSKYSQIRVRINGVDVFHPATGEVRSDDADGIACWFIDTDYNEESFFVRQAYFLGANDPYKSLKTTLKAEIDQEAWESLHSDTSREFAKPEGGRIAVKVINHLGDEVMKVFRVE